MFVLGYRYDGAKRTTFGSSFWNNEEQTGSDCHVATSPRRDVPTSRRPLENLHLIIKCQKARNLGHREAYEEKHGIPEQSDTVFEEVPGICTAFHVFDILGY